MVINYFTGLEQVGEQMAGDSLDFNPGTVGGQNDYVFTRTYKVNSNNVQAFLYQILNPAVRVTDATIPNAYLVKQRASKVDEVNMHLSCVFAQIPSSWDDFKDVPASFPGVLPSTLYTPYDFPYRSSTYTKESKCRYNFQYFLGPPRTIPTVPLFQPVDSDGNRVSVISDFTTPSADTYISLVGNRGEIVLHSTVNKWKGDIWELKTTYAEAK